MLWIVEAITSSIWEQNHHKTRKPNYVDKRCNELGLMERKVTAFAMVRITTDDPSE